MSRWMDCVNGSQIGPLMVGDLVAKAKTASRCKINGWLSANQDCKEKIFLQVGLSLLESKAYGKLPDAAKSVYLAMCIVAGKNREFYFSKGIAANYGFKDERRYYRGVKALTEAGFIEKIEEPGAAQYAPSRYRFIFEWKGVTSHK